MSKPVWVTTDPNSGSGNGKVTVTAQANAGAARSGNVSLAGSGVSKDVAIEQGGTWVLNQLGGTGYITTDPLLSSYPIRIDNGQPFNCLFKVISGREFHFVWLFQFSIGNASIVNPDFAEDKQPLDFVPNPNRPNEFEIGGIAQLGHYHCNIFDTSGNKYEIEIDFVGFS